MKMYTLGKRMVFSGIINLTGFLLLVSPFAKAQDSTRFSTYYFQRLTHFRTLPAQPGSTIFLGNSITDGAEWSELFGESHILNRGISGDITAGVLYRLPEIIKQKPSRLFLLIGVNDLARGIPADTVAASIFKIAGEIGRQIPQTKLFIQSLLPVNDELGKFPTHVNKGKEINHINARLRDSANSFGYTFIDLHSLMVGEDGKLRKEYTNDGLHLKGDGYLAWQQAVYPFVYDATVRPELIPQPQKVSWTVGFIPLYKISGIRAGDTSLQKIANRFSAWMEEQGWDVVITRAAADKTISLHLGKVVASQNEEEAYHLSVSEKGVNVTANTPHGVYNALQTLRQLMRNNLTIPYCEITDWPAFSWRGYMIDVGRNYMTPDLLKQQIDVAGQYKFNIFHFHLTEDIAWRLAIKRYPELTAPENMLRNKGRFYSENDLKNLIQYCKERFITLVPEIDMPGHSDAFKRAMKTDMQSEQGMVILKNILKEVFETYDIPIIHIGGDEVKITNKNFLPEIFDFIRGYNKKIVGWEPGGNLTDDVIRQLWTGDAGNNLKGKQLEYIDSKLLYINHMDPLESVVSIFFHQISAPAEASGKVLGATLCTWPDRRVENEADVLTMNPVYPAMLAFAERSWRGGGDPQPTTTIGSPGSPTAKVFNEFENRLMNHKRQYFAETPFPYTRQSGSVWTLYGPYPNGGNLAAEPGPETNHFDTTGLPVIGRIEGGTVILRHWWYPVLTGALANPQDSTTVYAHQNLWSDEDGWTYFWIGFNDLSRSPATDSPPEGEWDEKMGKVWVNGEEIAPPHWLNGGKKGNSEVPLFDEGYTYRKPNSIFLKKGWNSIWIKVPVGTFKGRDWQNPVKWMFTFIKI